MTAKNWDAIKELQAMIEMNFGGIIQHSDTVSENTNMINIAIESSKENLEILKYYSENIETKKELDHVKGDIAEIKALLLIQIYAMALKNINT